MATLKKLWILIFILAALTPIGLILPAYFQAGPAWGEWSLRGIKKLIGYIPQGLIKLSSFWNAPLPDYAFRNQSEKALSGLGIAYIISAIVGIMITTGIMFLIGKFLSKKD